MGAKITPLNNKTLCVLVHGALIESLLLSMMALGDLRAKLPVFLVCYGAAFAVYALVLRGMDVTRGRKEDDDANTLPLIIAFALLFRATLFLKIPWLSEDIYRYLWDGRSLGAGINPYQYVPGAEELAHQRDSLYELINHKEIGTPYGPLSLLLFHAGQVLSDSIHAMKLPFVVCDMLIVFVLIDMLRRLSLPRTNVIVYAWSPLVLIEVAGNGHNDSLAVALLLLSLYAAIRMNGWLAVTFFSLAFLAKYLALIFLPAFWGVVRRTQWTLFPVLIGLGFIPFVGHLESHIINVGTVGALWQFNDSVFWLLNWATGSPGASKVIASTLFLSVCAWVVYRRPGSLKSAMILIGTALCLTTTLQPWYMLWIIPFLCIYPSRAWVLLSGLVMLSYQVLVTYDASGVWAENLWIKLAIYVPFYCLLAQECLTSLRQRRTPRRVVS